MYGADVDIYGDYAIVGAPGITSNAGRAYIYKYESSNWQVDQVIVPGSAAESYFGSSVQIHNDIAFVGAEGENRVYQLQNDGSSWNFIDTIYPVGGASAFGASLDYDGTTLLVGDDEGNAVFAYTFNGTDWVGQKLTASDGTSNDYFGCDVSVSGNYAVVGAWAKSSMTGAAYIFKKSNDTWSQYQKIVASNGNNNDRFGTSVAIQNTELVVGAFYDNPSSIGDYAGSAYLFQAPPPPAPEISQQPQNADVCEGNNAIFSLTASDAESYQWCNSLGALTDGGDISGATTNQLTIANAEDADEDQFYCIVSNSVGSVISDTVTLTVDALIEADAGEDMKICDGSATLNGNTPTEGTGTWTIVGGTATIDDPNDPQTNVTIYGENAELSWTIVNGACNSSDNVNISNVIASFAASPVVTQFPNTYIHIENNSSNNANAYVWDFGDGIQQTQDSYIDDFDYHYDTWGDFTITLKAYGNDCFSLDTQDITILAPDNIQENDYQINIVPNPAKNFITINGLEANSQIFIYNSNGKLLIDSRLNKNNTLDISQLPEGVYFLRTSEPEKEILLKFIKK